MVRTTLLWELLAARAERDARGRTVDTPEVWDKTQLSHHIGPTSKKKKTAKLAEIPW